ncbi:MAG: glycine C-acetyltransferase [candidate division WOR-3 bacterium]|nr:glycine C-acetyltransferase [candidate division WOR-3 bacterium]MCX7947266.1 glycine C-acetyltransferase [candidate division WOR-3 bacterium]MDW8150177.1 glycine C-acetyltransferase [candidate division WOR-3 bacterium]
MKLGFIVEELEKLKNEGLYVNIRTIESEVSSWFIVDNKKCLNLTSNNYLGFASEKKLVEKVIEYIKIYGISPAAVRTISGTMSLHVELERKLAKFKHVEDVILLQSGFMANLAVIPAIVSSEDVIFSDELNHASIIDGCRLSKAEIVRYRHLDMNDLEDKIKKYSNKRRKLIVSDGVFSMDGDIAPLNELIDISNRYGAILMIDDAHGEGVLGRNGRGIVDHFDAHGKVDIEVGTLSKAFGVVGGFVAGSRFLIEYLKQRARPFLFSSALTVADTAANLGALEIMESSDERVKKLWENKNYFQNQLVNMGFNIGSTKTPITPVIVGEEKKAQEFSKKLFENNIFVQAIVYPTVPKGTARLRVMLSAIHKKEDLDFALETFEKIGKELAII